MKPDRFIATTGDASRHLPEGPVGDELLGLVRIGLRFRAQQCGRHPGLLARLVLDCARRAGPPYSFRQLLDELDTLAAERADVDARRRLSPVESVNRIWELVRIYDPKRGEIQVTFSTLRGHLTRARKILKA